MDNGDQFEALEGTSATGNYLSVGVGGAHGAPFFLSSGLLFGILRQRLRVQMYCVQRCGEPYRCAPKKNGDSDYSPPPP
jgi:hypothetical protein